MALDGHLNAWLEGKTIELVEKDGMTMIIHLTTGQRVRIGWYDGPRKQKGEPQFEGCDAVVSLARKPLL